MIQSHDDNTVFARQAVDLARTISSGDSPWIKARVWQRIGEETPGKDPSGGLDHDETAGLLENAVAELARRSPRCGDIFRHILESHERGGGQREISQRAFETVCLEHPDLTRNTFYVALHRCRAQLRSLMDRMETGVGHA